MERLRESYTFEFNQYTRLTEQQVQNLNIKPRLTENQLTLNEVLSAAKQIRSTLQEKDQQMLDQILAQLREKGFENSFKVWKLPIGKYGNLNGNKRVYPRKLWENVRDRQHSTWKGFCGLCDHPVADNDPGEFKNQAVIWHNMDVGDDNTVYGYCSFVGPYGHLAQEILEHGGRVGTSSSGFGDVDPVTKTVDPETYVIERLADLVLNPSQGTFGTGDCPHTPAEFLNNVHQGATIEFGKQQSGVVREAASTILRRKSMADQMKYDAAAQPGQQQQQPAAPAQGGAQQPANGQAAGAAPAQPQGAQQQVQESMKVSTTLTKVEEKAFRKYVQTFIDDANKLDNPIQRLNECVDILNCFDEGNCPDLREALEKQLLEEKGKLEQLVEKVVSTEKDYDMDIGQFREAAERNTAAGLLLQEQVTDYKELCDGLAKRNVQLREENDKLKKKLNIKDKLSEKRIMQMNKTNVDKSSEVESLQEQVETLAEKNERLIERVSKLAMSNKEFEKENDMLTNKLKEAGNIMKGVKQRDTVKLQESQKIEGGIVQLQERIRELEAINKEIELNYDAQSKRFDKLQEDFAAYKQEVNDTYNPIARMQPKFEERVGKYLNLREGKGAEVEAYWNDLSKRYGEVITPFEQQIRGAKTLREATSAFLKYRTSIDSDFAVAQPQEHAYRNREERARLYEYQGIVNPVTSYQESSTEQKNEEFLKQLRASGLQ